MSQPRTSSQTRLPTRNRSRSPASRPTTPLRPSSRSSFRTSQTSAFVGPSPLDNFEPQFAELSDSMADLEANLMHLQLMHESLGRFAESFASFLYGLNMNAFVVDFPEAPISESFKRFPNRHGQGETDEQTLLQTNSTDSRLGEAEATFLNTDASFTSLKATPRRKTTAPSITPSTTSTFKQSNVAGRGGIAGRASRATGRGARASSLPRGRGRGAR
ncbi:DASH complex subunit DAM1 [Capronia epimyces CBS 606.96]|uniref:DASH complex subunit DAM1 n=1 Tax=Capronia epimyces CBS 606.96 TaxID=1182542 RepID=W9YAZ3_9EURO|nr:DASH complex subunit DAM1 [Capronia epimyces CBS 606.96]EXJ90022.1 DASH complex subunit DAM1 [Capronia epimyces CBS 606.96]